jgi:hypothetical protein
VAPVAPVEPVAPVTPVSPVAPVTPVAPDGAAQCATTGIPTLADPTAGPITLSFRVNFASTSDTIIIRGIGLLLKTNGKF